MYTETELKLVTQLYHSLNILVPTDDKLQSMSIDVEAVTYCLYLLSMANICSIRALIIYSIAIIQFFPFKQLLLIVN